MIKLKACNISKLDQAKVFYNIEDRSFDTYPILNTDIGLVVAYINRGKGIKISVAACYAIGVWLLKK